MRYNVFVSTFHKTGSVWMRNTFLDLTKALSNVTFANVSKHASDWRTLDELNTLYEKRLAEAKAGSRRLVFFDTHSHVVPAMSANNLRGFGVVRDPRDIVISAVGYHQKSSEKWLHRPKESFGGLTYAEKINSLDDFDDRIAFEMDNSAGRVIERMADFARRREKLELVKYEDLITDTELVFWSSLMKRIGFNKAEVEEAKTAFWNRSLFGNADIKGSAHVSDGSIAQWRNKLSDAQVKVIEARFGNEIEALGYPI